MRDETVAEISAYLARICPELLVMNFTHLEDYDKFLRGKAILAARIKDCASSYELGKCENCPYEKK